jgi:DNA polymerase I
LLVILKGIDSILKWMLVTCFGYTGYCNAKFGQIQVHEKITENSKELLLQIELAESMGFEVLTWDCILTADCWRAYILVQGGVEKETGILTQADSYDWIVFLPISYGTKQMKNP